MHVEAPQAILRFLHVSLGGLVSAHLSSLNQHLPPDFVFLAPLSLKLPKLLFLRCEAVHLIFLLIWAWLTEAPWQCLTSTAMLRHYCIDRLLAEHPSAMVCSAGVGAIAALRPVFWSAMHAVFCASIHA